MKRLFSTHFYLGRLANLAGDNFSEFKTEEVNVRPTFSRWFCGMHDMESTYICQLM